ncbi:MAG: DoxX family protein [Geodermatophilaceae bacterium]|nr:DoxX family protein [Geodermatophilaceae bacterium]
MLVRRIARPLLASIFVSGGINALRSVEGHADMASPVAEKTANALPGNLPTDPAQLVKIDAAVKVGAGTLLALNKFPRICAILLSGSLIPTTLAGHRFWEESDPNARMQQQAHFFKNLGLLGGLILAAVDTEGKPSVGWRARRAVHDFSDSTRNVAGDAADATRRGASAVRDVAPF